MRYTQHCSHVVAITMDDVINHFHYNFFQKCVVQLLKQKQSAMMNNYEHD